MIIFNRLLFQGFQAAMSTRQYLQMVHKLKLGEYFNMSKLGITF